MSNTSYQFHGTGVGLRNTHIDYVIENKPTTDFFEIISENFIDTQGVLWNNLLEIRRDYPVIAHGVSMSIGSTDPVNYEYLDKLKRLIDNIDPLFVSDHICWTGLHNINSHELLPLSYNQKVLNHLCERIDLIQNYLKRQILLENPSSYIVFSNSSIAEGEFINQMVKKSGCALLLDVNNIYVSSYNNGLDSQEYVDSIPLDSVGYIHLAGYADNGSHCVDTHGAAVSDVVWDLYRYVLHKAGRKISTMVEWDANIPSFDQLLLEANKAQHIIEQPINNIEEITGRLYKAPIAQQALQELGGQDKEKTMQELMDVMHKIVTGDSEHINHCEKFDHWFQKNNDNFTLEDRLSIYRRGCFFGRNEVVTIQFDLLKYFLDDAEFEILVKEFILDVPSTHYDITAYPVEFVEYLQKNSLQLYKNHEKLFKYSNQVDHNFLHQIAQFANHRIRTFDKDSKNIIDLETIQTLNPEELLEAEFEKDSSVLIIQSDYDLSQILDEYLADLPINNYYDYKLDKSQHFALYLQNQRFKILELSIEQVILVENITQHNFAFALEKLFDLYTEETIGENIATWLFPLINNGIIYRKL